MLDTINDKIASTGGSWVKLKSKADGTVEGEILDVEERERTDPEGNVVLSRKTGKPRIEWVVTLRVPETDRDPSNPDDDGTRKLALNESGRFAFTDAVKAAGTKVEVGGTLKFGVKEDRESEYKQPTYQARYTPPAKQVDPAVNQAVAAAADDDDEPF